MSQINAPKTSSPNKLPSDLVNNVVTPKILSVFQQTTSQPENMAAVEQIQALPEMIVTREEIAPVKKQAKIRKSDMGIKFVQLDRKLWEDLASLSRKIQFSRRVRSPKITENSIIRSYIRACLKYSFDTREVKDEMDLSSRIEIALRNRGEINKK